MKNLPEVGCVDRTTNREEGANGLSLAMKGKEF